jgi:hypothetical protein
MRGLASKTRPARRPGLPRFVRRACPSWSHPSGAGGTAKKIRQFGICLTCPTCLTYFEINRRKTGKQDWRSGEGIS